MTGSIVQFAGLIIPLIFAIVCHEVAHGWVARSLGDPTARDARRLSLNPFRHVDPIGTVVLPGMLALLKLPVFGWAKPVPIDASRLRNPRIGMMLVAAAGPATNLLLGLIGAIAIGLVQKTDQTTGWVVPIDNFVMINIFLAIFNLLPVPPFDGSHIVEGLLPRRAALVYERLRPLGLPLMLGLLVVLPWLAPQMAIVGNLVMPPALWIYRGYGQVGGWIASL